MAVSLSRRPQSHDPLVQGQFSGSQEHSRLTSAGCSVMLPPKVVVVLIFGHTISTEGLYHMTFQDLILVYWADPIKDGANPKLAAFIDLAQESRYWFSKCNRNCGLYPIGEISSIKELVVSWIEAPPYSLAPGESRTLYFGFQNDPGWTLQEFHDILKTLDRIAVQYGVKVEWLCDNWFDHPGMTPTLRDGEHALEWIEQQLVNTEPYKINYEFKGAQHDYSGQPATPPPF